jgi:hypothetical protein
MKEQRRAGACGVRGRCAERRSSKCVEGAHPLTDHDEISWCGIAETLAAGLLDKAVLAAVHMIKPPEGQEV